MPMDDDMSDDDDYGDYSVCARSRTTRKRPPEQPLTQVTQEASDNSFVPAKGKEKGVSVAIKANALAKGLHDRKEEVVKKGTSVRHSVCPSPLNASRTGH